MSLTIKHLNDDASFLLSFQPVLQCTSATNPPYQPFTIVLDPWLTGSSKIWHEKFSISHHIKPSCIDSLSDLAQEPDLVIVSQDKTDHCHAPTLRTLHSDSKTVILADPGSTKVIRGWKHFDNTRVVAMKRWDEKSNAIWRREIPPLEVGGLEGQITVAYIAPAINLTGLHSAIGITYRPPTYRTNLLPSPELPLTPPPSPGRASLPRTLSVIFSPHGVPYTALHLYAQSHLLQETASLPLTALIHSFDRISNPWYLGGNICAGFPGGVEIARKLRAGTWISAHDENKDTTGIASKALIIRRWDRDKVEEEVRSMNDGVGIDEKGNGGGTKAVVLDVGEEIVLALEALKEGEVVDENVTYKHGDSGCM